MKNKIPCNTQSFHFLCFDEKWKVRFIRLLCRFYFIFSRFSTFLCVFLQFFVSFTHWNFVEFAVFERKLFDVFLFKLRSVIFQHLTGLCFFCYFELPPHQMRKTVREKCCCCYRLCFFLSLAFIVLTKFSFQLNVTYQSPNEKSEKKNRTNKWSFRFESLWKRRMNQIVCLYIIRIDISFMNWQKQWRGSSRCKKKSNVWKIKHSTEIRKKNKRICAFSLVLANVENK